MQPTVISEIKRTGVFFLFRDAVGAVQEGLGDKFLGKKWTIFFNTEVEVDSSGLRRGKYLPLYTDTEVNNCFNRYQTSLSFPVRPYAGQSKREI